MEAYNDILVNDWEVDEEVTDYMYQVSVLGKFIAGLGMSFAVLTTLKTLFHLFKPIITDDRLFYGMTFLIAVAGALIAGTFYFSVSFFTYRFAVKLQYALKHADQPSFRAAWQHFKLCFRMMGIMFIFYSFLMLVGIFF